MDEKALRIRLEGALEQVEEATERLERAGGLLRGDWRHQAGAQLPLLKRVRAYDAEADATVAKMAALAQKERWPEGSPGRLAIERYRRAHGELEVRARQALLLKTDGGFDALLGAVIKEALPPPGGVLMRAKLDRDPGPLVVSLGVLFFIVWLVPAISTRIGGVCVGVGALVGLLAGLPWLLSGGWVLLYADRVRHQGRIGGNELPLKPNLLTAHLLKRPNAPPRSQLLVPGWRALAVPQVEAEELQALASLLGRPPFEAPYPPEADGVCLRASRLNAKTPPHGALWLGSRGAWFIADGSESYDAATQQAGRGPSARARALGVALSAVGPERSRPILERLVAAGRAEQLDPRTLELAKVEAKGVTIGQLRAWFERRERQEVLRWLSARRGQAT